MCYLVYLSTTSPEDLSARSSSLTYFEKPRPDDPIAPALLFEHKWYLATAVPGSCSCHFRHTMNPELGFGEPVDWYPEDSEDLEATARFVSIVRELLGGGHQVDTIDAWWDADPGKLRRMDVDLGAVGDEQFRFFENYHFVFTAGGRSG